MKSYLPILGAILLLTIAACTTDALPEPEITPCDGIEPTYIDDIRPIIEASCAYAGCHLGDAPGIYVDYEGMLPNLESGLLRERTIDLQDDDVFGMPPEYAPEDRPRSLTEEELLLIDCWLTAGFPEM
ncbi:hypothetical protein CEQ90_01655 [Lewinellaceae bacterium SD302]|nr:hypothetical protein CEQ90_01655 [Lewinellaceae bacterium SD302]